MSLGYRASAGAGEDKNRKTASKRGITRSDEKMPPDAPRANSQARRQEMKAAKPAAKSGKAVKAAAPKTKAAKPAAKVAAKAPVKAKPASKSPVKATVKPKAKAKAVAKTPAKKAAPAKPAKTSPVAKKVPAKPAKAQAKPVPGKATKPAPKKPVASKPLPVAKKAPAPKPVAKAPPPGKPPAKPMPAPKPSVKPAVAPPVSPPVMTKPATGKASGKSKQVAPAPVAPTPVQGLTGAKASFTPSMPTTILTPPPVVVVKKDPKLANNWKNKTAEELSDNEVLAMPDTEYMNDKQMAFFRHKLVALKQSILNNADETTEHLREDTVIVPDPADRATIEEEHALELRTRDRERKLLKKIEQSIGRIDAGDYGYCDETGEPIGVGRLLARPTATLSLEAQQRRELKQRMFGD
jgi:DnaK suppressor protein